VTQRALPPNRLEKALGSQQSQLLAILVLCVICCASALGAPSPMAACDQTADLQSLEIPVNKLSAMVVGHVIVDLGERDDASIDALPAKSNPEAPIIDLELRVADILQDVFSAAAVKTPSSDSSDQPLPIESSPKGNSPLSPVAGDASQADSPELADPDAGLDDSHSAPSIQRQMFRTDI